MDGRSKQGLVRAQERVLLKKDYAEANLMKAYLRQIETCLTLVPEKIAALSDSQLLEGLMMLEQEQVAIPPALQHALLVRQVQDQLAKKAFVDVVPLINPFGEGKFDLRSPRLCAMEHPQKLQFFQRILFHDVLIPLLYEGELASNTVVGLCKVCLSTFSDVDPLYEDATIASGHEECCAIWAALLACGTVSLESSIEDDAEHYHESYPVSTTLMLVKWLAFGFFFLFGRGWRLLGQVRGRIKSS